MGLDPKMTFDRNAYCLNLGSFDDRRLTGKSDN
jgi:hypothetical protein